MASRGGLYQKALDHRHNSEHVVHVKYVYDCIKQKKGIKYNKKRDSDERAPELSYVMTVGFSLPVNSLSFEMDNAKPKTGPNH